MGSIAGTPVASGPSEPEHYCHGCHVLDQHIWEVRPGAAPVAPHMIRTRICKCCGLEQKSSSWTGEWPEVRVHEGVQEAPG